MAVPVGAGERIEEEKKGWRSCIWERLELRLLLVKVR